MWEIQQLQVHKKTTTKKELWTFSIKISYNTRLHSTWKLNIWEFEFHISFFRMRRRHEWQNKLRHVHWMMWRLIQDRKTHKTKIKVYDNLYCFLSLSSFIVIVWSIVEFYCLCWRKEMPFIMIWKIEKRENHGFVHSNKCENENGNSSLCCWDGNILFHIVWCLMLNNVLVLDSILHPMGKLVGFLHMYFTSKIHGNNTYFTFIPNLLH